MPSDKSFAINLIESLEPLELQVRPMFGEFAVYLKGKVVGLICDNTLFVKITPSGESLAGRIQKGEPYPGAKVCFRISETKLKNAEWMREMLERTEVDLPESKSKRKK